MAEANHPFGILRELTWSHVLLVLLVLFGCRVLVGIVRWLVHRAAESAPSHRRLVILRAAPIARLLIGIGGIAIIVPIIVEPTFDDIIALLATIALALAFALKDYVSSVVAGLVTILENTYQPGDWIEVDGTYGEVKTIGMRAVHIVTSDDTEVIIPHAKLWSTSVFNASSGSHSLLCVTNFYLRADHDGDAVRKMLVKIADTSSYRKPETTVTVVAAELPWGTRYKLKAYVSDSRDQYAMITDLTIRGKEQLRGMGVVFAQASYAENKSP
ncbi:MAG TPA: mechanosensitive ion channel domain-containing protein [Rhizomicrobium sp.]